MQTVPYVEHQHWLGATVHRDGGWYQVVGYEFDAAGRKRSRLYQYWPQSFGTG